MRSLRLLVPLLLFLLVVPVIKADHNPPGGIPKAAESATISRVVDGDTVDVRLEDGTEDTVRLIGMDTPEVHSGTECYGPEASDRLARLLKRGREVWLERDESDRDRFDRLLRYVWVEKENGDQYLVNEVMVRDGFAEAKRYEPDTRRARTLERAEQRAQERGLGIWSACPEYQALLSTPTPVPVPTEAPVVSDEPITEAPEPTGSCDPSYPDFCLQPGIPDLDCGEIGYRRFTVYQPDPHGFDGDYDGMGCESG